MQVPVYGNNAYKYEQEYYQAPKKKVVRKVRARKKEKTGAKSVILLGIAICLAFALLLSNAQMLEKTNQIEELERKLEGLNAQAVAGRFEIERNMDLNKVEEEAITRLGMQRPTKAQTVYINMGNCDYAEAVEKTEKKNVFSAIANNVLEYFG